MTSPIRRFGVPYEQSAGRSLRKNVTFIIVFSGTSVAPVKQSLDDAMFHDGNFDQSVSSQVFFEG